MRNDSGEQRGSSGGGTSSGGSTSPGISYRPSPTVAQTPAAIAKSVNTIGKAPSSAFAVGARATTRDGFVGIAPQPSAIFAALDVRPSGPSDAAPAPEPAPVLSAPAPAPGLLDVPTRAAGEIVVPRAFTSKAVNWKKIAIYGGGTVGVLGLGWLAYRALRK